MTLVLIKGSIAVIKFHDQMQLRRKEFPSLKLLYHSPPPKKVRARLQGQNLKAGTNAESMKRCYFLAFTPWLNQFVSSCNPETLAIGSSWHNF